MSLTYISAIVGFLVANGLLSQADAESLTTIIALAIPMIITLIGRYRAGGLHWTGFRK